MNVRRQTCAATDPVAGHSQGSRHAQRMVAAYVGVAPSMFTKRLAQGLKPIQWEPITRPITHFFI